jgi:DNA-binding NarL/FixJ family response regulator
MPISILIADDHEVVRSGIESLLLDTDIEIVGQAASGSEAVKLAHELQPDIVLLDIRMVEADGLAALEEIRSKLPNTRVIMLSTYDNPTYVARAAALGASDYLLKGCSREDLLGAIHAVAAGEVPSRHGVMHKVADTMAIRQKTREEDVVLTQRETQVLRHLALGLSNKEIGMSLQISVETVKEHVQHILRKIDATDRTQAAVWAVRRGMV